MEARESRPLILSAPAPLFRFPHAFIWPRIAAVVVTFLATNCPAQYTTTNTETSSSDWNSAIWRFSGIGSPVGPISGDTYQTVFNGAPFGNNLNNTRVRNPAVAGIQTFVGASLTLNTNTELRAQMAGSIINFPGVNGNPGLILNGGVLNAAADTVFTITGEIQVASQSQSYICPADNGGGAVKPLRGFNIAGQLTGNGTIVICQAGTNTAQQISGTSNTFSGLWLVKAGWLLGSATGSLGTNNITVDPGYVLPLDHSITNVPGPAIFDVNYDINSAGQLTLTNGGMMNLHQNCIFGAVVIEGTALTNATYSYATLAALFPNNFLPGGDGTITVQLFGPPPVFPPTVSQQPSPALQYVFTGGPANLSALFAGAPPITYQWKISLDQVNYTDIPGATNTTLALTNGQTTNTAYYSLWASNAYSGGVPVGTSNALVQLLGPAPALKRFPLSANSRGTITCLANPSYTYDIYLPPGYLTNGTPLPLLYTMWPNGGGMVSQFQAICSSMNIICVGITGTSNTLPLDTVLREFYSDALDIRQRVLFDPTAEFCAGFSGGGEFSYEFSRFRSQHVSGVLAMSGWLGRVNGPGLTNVNYYSNDRLQTNLLIARTTGTQSGDSGTQFYNPFDSNFLTSCGTVLQDWTFNGGHEAAPDSLKVTTLQWLLAQRTPAGIFDASNALAQAANWRSRIASGDSENVLRECVSNLMIHPRSWPAAEAQLVMDDMMTNYASFRSINVSNLFPVTGAYVTNNFSLNTNCWSQNDFASDMFYYYARAAATNRDFQRYDSCLKCLTGIPGVNNDRLGDFYTLLLTNSYPGPILQTAIDPNSGQMTVSLQKDAPSLAYTLQSSSDLTSSNWQNFSPSVYETDTVWSASFTPDPTSTNGFYRMNTAPTLLGPSPPYPTQSF